MALALRDAGWYLRSDVVWQKANPTPESVRDRPTRAHEYVFLLAKSESYFYDWRAVREPAVSTSPSENRRRRFADEIAGYTNGHRGERFAWRPAEDPAERLRNRRSVWTTTSSPFRGGHLATFPPALVEPMVLSSTRPGDAVLDPFFGSGTVGAVAEKLGRRWVGFDLRYQDVVPLRFRQLGAAYPGPAADPEDTAVRSGTATTGSRDEDALLPER